MFRESGSPPAGAGSELPGQTNNLQQFKNRAQFDGVTATDPARRGRFAVLLDPLASGAIGRGIVAGVAPVRVLVTRETDPFAEIIAGETEYLRSVPDGLTRMLWKAAGLGVQWAVVQLAERPRMAIFQLSGTWQASVPPEPDGWMKMTGCLPVYYVDSTHSYQSDTSEPAETVWHAVGYPPAERVGVISLHKTLGLVPASSAVATGPGASGTSMNLAGRPWRRTKTTGDSA